MERLSRAQKIFVHMTIVSLLLAGTVYTVTCPLLGAYMNYKNSIYYYFMHIIDVLVLQTTLGQSYTCILQTANDLISKEELLESVTPIPHLPAPAEGQ